MSAMSHSQMSPAPSSALVIAAIWWALILHAALSVLIQ
jgi:hypothetical protein